MKVGVLLVTLLTSTVASAEGGNDLLISFRGTVEPAREATCHLRPSGPGADVVRQEIETGQEDQDLCEFPVAADRPFRVEIHADGHHPYTRNFIGFAGKGPKMVDLGRIALTRKRDLLVDHVLASRHENRIRFRIDLFNNLDSEVLVTQVEVQFSRRLSSVAHAGVMYDYRVEESVQVLRGSAETRSALEGRFRDAADPGGTYRMRGYLRNDNDVAYTMGLSLPISAPIPASKYSGIALEFPESFTTVGNTYEVISFFGGRSTRSGSLDGRIDFFARAIFTIEFKNRGETGRAYADFEMADLPAP